MHRRTWRALALAWALAGGAWAADAPAPSTAAVDIAALQARAATLQKAIEQETQDNGKNLPYLAHDIDMIRDWLGQGRLGDAANHANHVADYAPSAATKALADSLADAIRRATAQRDGAVLDQFDASLAKVGADVLAAKEAKDLDGIVPSLYDQRAALDSSGMSGERRNLLQQKFQGAIEFVNRWQEYLVARAAGNDMEARNVVRNLANNNAFLPIPRSRLLALASNPGDAPAGAGPALTVKTLDDIPAVLQRIDAMNRTGGGGYALMNAMNALQALQRAAADYRAGRCARALQEIDGGGYGAIWNTGLRAGGPASDEAVPGMAALQNDLLFKIVAGLLDRPNASPPKDGEPATAYLQRLAAADAQASRWPELQRDLEIRLQVTGGFGGPVQDDDLAALRAYRIGDRQEQAGQILDAIRSYRQSLATLGTLFTGQPAAARLADLQKKYPDLYQQALQQPVARAGQP